MRGSRILEKIDEEIRREQSAAGNEDFSGGYRDGYGDSTYSDYDDSWHEDVE